MAITFCETIRDAGFTPGVYANPSWFETYYKKNEIVGVYDIWLACWTYNPDIPPRWRYGEKIWQYGLRKIGKYHVHGIEGAGVASDYIVIGINGAVTAALHAEDLIKA